MIFDAREATVKTVHHALFSGQASCRDIVEAFLARIELHNPTINAVVCLNPHALDEADDLDRKLAGGLTTGLLFGVPVLLKDNFDAVGMPTTVGSLAFQDVWPTADAETVTALRRAGAVILGKANMHEFAFEGLTVSSLGGQTFNPYDLTRTPGGSSGGSGAAVAASFAVMATGTDTINSLRSPASANSLYSFRPTPGLISRKGVVPVSSTQDAVGMIGRSLLDISIALNVMSGSTTDEASHKHEADYTQALTTSSPKLLSSFRIGVLHGFFDEDQHDSEPLIVNKALADVISILEDEGATICHLHQTEPWDAPMILSTMDLQTYENCDLINTYLSSPSLRGQHPISFHNIFSATPTSTSTGNHSDSSYLVIPSQYDHIRSVLSPAHNTTHPSYKLRQAFIEDLTKNLHDLFESNSISCIIYPQQRHLVVPVGSSSQSGRNGILAAVTGSPVVCMPVGFSPPSATAPIGLPIGMEILGLPGSEKTLFEVARGIDELLCARRSPVTAGLEGVAGVGRSYDQVPVIKPLGLKSVDLEAYPPGKH